MPTKLFVFSTEAAREHFSVHNATLSHRLSKQFVAKDKAILIREAKAINATVDWTTYRNRFEIAIHAPEGFVWAATGESTLTCTYERLSTDSAREAVRECIAEMGLGYDDKRNVNVSDEDHEYYEEEPRELDFT